MIKPGTQLTVARVPLARILVSEHQVRYPESVLHYIRLLSDPAHAEEYAGLVHLAPYGDLFRSGEKLENLYTLLDGHHRFAASLLAGRSHLLAVIHREPGWPAYEARDEAADGATFTVPAAFSTVCPQG